jgi:hypothetical protein
MTGKVLCDIESLTQYHSSENKRIILVKNPQNELMGDIWNLEPIAITRTQVFVVCPLCGEIHIHGNNDTGCSGMRVTHCKSNSDVYFVRKIKKEG